MTKISIFCAILVLFGSRCAQACSGNEVSRTCECSAMYTAGEYDLVDSMGVSIAVESKLKRLFTVKSYDDCGVNLGCELAKEQECARYCTSQIIDKLASSSVINDRAKESLCQLVMGEDPLFENGIRLFASWKYSSCKSGYSVIVKNVCCNRVCDCKLLRSSVVSPGVESLIYGDRIKQKAFLCDKASDDPCLSECRNKMATYVRDPLLASSNSVNLNLFANQATANHVCSLLQPDVIASPGVQIVLRVETNRYKYVNYVQLGQICCYGDQVCKCGLSLRGFDTTGAQSLKATIIDYSLTPANKGYQCHSELKSCIEECRNGMLPPAYDPTQLTSDLYPLDTQLAIKVCSSLQNDVFPAVSPQALEDQYKNGIDVFIEYNKDNAFPEHEQLFLGRLCCRNSPIGLAPSIRCL